MALEEFTSGGARDFRQRYLGVWGYYPTPSGEKLLVYMSQINERETKFSDAKGIEYTAKADQGVFFQFIPIEKRLFVYDNMLVLAERRPARQYSRGVSEANTSFREITYADTVLITAKTIVAYANPVYEVVIDASKTVQLLSPMFGIKHGSIYLYDRRIGSVQYDKNLKLQLRVDEPLFYQELVDVVRERKINVEVVKA